MEESDRQAVQAALQALNTAAFALDRVTAARTLGRLSSSSEEIVQALAAAQVLDEHANVQEAAAEALQSPVHQELLKDHPGLLSEAMEGARRAKEQRDRAGEDQLSEEFLRRRARQRMLGLLPAAGALLYFISVIVLIEQHEWFYPLATVIFFVFMGWLLWLSWRTWRCPSCDGWLGSWRAQINPFFSTSPAWCPHCGKKLL